VGSHRLLEREMLAFQRIFECSPPLQDSVEHHEDTDVPLADLCEDI
jgi:hypothetical protein